MNILKLCPTPLFGMPEWQCSSYPYTMHAPLTGLLCACSSGSQIPTLILLSIYNFLRHYSSSSFLNQKIVDGTRITGLEYLISPYSLIYSISHSIYFIPDNPSKSCLYVAFFLNLTFSLFLFSTSVFPNQNKFLSSFKCNFSIVSLLCVLPVLIPAEFTTHYNNKNVFYMMSGTWLQHSTFLASLTAFHYCSVSLQVE
jgi:hypothetical protein